MYARVSLGRPRGSFGPHLRLTEGPAGLREGWRSYGARMDHGVVSYQEPPRTLRSSRLSSNAYSRLPDSQRSHGQAWPNCFKCKPSCSKLQSVHNSIRSLEIVLRTGPREQRVPRAFDSNTSPAPDVVGVFPFLFHQSRSDSRMG